MNKSATLGGSGGASLNNAKGDHEWIDTSDLSRRFKCSVRHVLRMADAGLMPWGKKFGALRRWSRREIEAWEADGCQPVRGRVQK